MRRQMGPRSTSHSSAEPPSLPLGSATPPPLPPPHGCAASPSAFHEWCRCAILRTAFLHFPLVACARLFRSPVPSCRTFCLPLPSSTCRRLHAPNHPSVRATPLALGFRIERDIRPDEPCDPVVEDQESRTHRPPRLMLAPG